MDPNIILRVTEQVKAEISKYCEISGQRNIFAGDSLSFFGSLDRVLGGYGKRPKKYGPYRLVICFKNKGNVFYKVYSYNARDNLICWDNKSNQFSDKILTLLKSNSQNLSFSGERLKLTKEEFVTRFRKLPMLSETMRMHISLKGDLKTKTKTDLNLELIHENKTIVSINFSSSNANQPMVTPSENPTPNPSATTPMGDIQKDSMKFIFKDDQFFLNLPAVHQEDLLAEIKSITLEALRNMTMELLQSNPKATIPPALDPSIYLNNSMQFFNQEGALDDYTRLFMIVLFYHLISCRMIKKYI